MKLKKSWIAVLTGLCMLCGTAPGLAAGAETGDRIYSQSDVYKYDFANAVLGRPITTTVADVINTWIPEGFNRLFSVMNGSDKEGYGFVYEAVEDAPGRPGDRVLKTSSATAVEQGDYLNNKYLYLRCFGGGAGANPAYPDMESLSVGSDGYLDFSFDFYTDGNTGMKMEIGSSICEDQSGTLSEINDKNRRKFFDLSTEGELKLFGTTVATLDREEINNQWHTIRFVLTGGNQCRVYWDDAEAPYEVEEVDYGAGLQFRGLNGIWLYNMGAAGAASVKYYDNIKYTVCKDITDRYQAPTVRFDRQESSVTIGEGDELSLTVTADTLLPHKIRVYLDENPVAEFDGAAGQYTYIGAKGVHVIEAEAEDAWGAVSDRAKLTVVVTEKITISGGFTGDSDSGTYSQQDARVIGFDADCANGLNRVEFFVNNALAETSKSTHTDFDFSAYGAGTLIITAVIYDSTGQSKRYTYTATVTLDKTQEVWSEDYEGYKSNSNVVGANIQIYHKNGYSQAVNIDAEHGTSMALGFEEDLGSDSGEYVNFANGSPGQHIAFETEFYLDAYPGTTTGVRFSLVESGSIQPTAFTIVGGNVHKESTDIQYKAGEWNRLYIDFDMPNRRYSVYVNGETLVKNYALASNFSALNWIRCYGPTKDGGKCYIAFDNTKISLVGSYGITSVCNGEGAELIRSKDKTLKITLSEGISAKSLTPDKVSITGENGSLRIGAATYTSADKSVTVTLKDALVGGKTYTVALSGEIATSAGVPIGAALSQSFRVEADAPMELVSAAYDGDAVQVALSTREAKPQEVLVLMSAWEGNRFCGVAATPVTIQPETVNQFRIPLAFAAGEELQIYVTDTLGAFHMLTEDVQTLQIK